MSEPAEVRARLLAAGYTPVPCVGKIPVLKGWQKQHDPTLIEIEQWSRTSPAATNTGILTRLTPTLDIDIGDPEAAKAIEDLVRERFEERGNVLVRFGRAPRRCIPFRTDTPFQKMVVDFDAHDGADQKPEKLEKLEMLAAGQQVVVAGIHPDTGKAYSWHGGEPGEVERRDLPHINEDEARALVDDTAALLVEKFRYRLRTVKPRKAGNGADDETPTDWSVDPIDHDQLTALAMRLLKSGMNAGAVHNFLRSQVAGLTGVDEDQRQRRLKEIPGMVESAAAKIEQERKPHVDPKPLDEVVKIFREWLALKDETPVYVTLGAVAANLLKGDPVWLGLIAPPSSAKTELLNSLSLLRFTKVVETFTPPALLSGSSKKDRARHATGGVLREIGDFGILLFKDFGSLLELRHEQRNDTMASLRRIYDGEYARVVGAEGGKTLMWRGKAGAIFGGTQSYDAHHAVSGTLGDRFLLFRVETMADEQLVKCRLQAGDNAKLMRQELAKAAAGVFAALPDPLPERENMTDSEYDSLSNVIREVIRLRAGIPRDGYRREIDDVHDPEGPARLSIALQQLFGGLVLIGVPRAKAAFLVERIAYDSAPKQRLVALRALSADWQTTREVAARIKLPTTTAKRALEELVAQGLALLEDAENDGQPAVGAHRWRRAP